MRKICFYLLAGSLPLQADIPQFDSLKKEEKWEQIVALGEGALLGTIGPQEEFAIRDQLVSSYFRLGEFAQAKKHAESLLILGQILNQPELVADSLYKFSAALRGEQQFNDARKFAKDALELCLASCPTNDALKAKILFNAGAAECDDLNGDCAKGIAMYQEAITLFTAVKDEDYRQRTLIRLGKAYLLTGNIQESRKIIEELERLQSEERTKMHFYYLKAQVLIAEDLHAEAKHAALEGKEIATRLHAKADIQRFEQLLTCLLVKS